MPGIVALNEDLTVGENVDCLILIWGAVREGEPRDGIAYVPDV